MNNFKIFNGLEGQFDPNDSDRESCEYPVGYAMKFIEFAGSLSRSLPVLA